MLLCLAICDAVALFTVEKDIALAEINLNDRKFFRFNIFKQFNMLITHNNGLKKDRNFNKLEICSPMVLTAAVHVAQWARTFTSQAEGWCSNPSRDRP